MSEASKKKLSESRLGLKLSDEVRLKRNIKERETKLRNKSFAKSKPEDELYEKLKEIYGNDNVLRNYRDKQRYPFNCDFYIKSSDMFIECNYF